MNKPVYFERVKFTFDDREEFGFMANQDGETIFDAEWEDAISPGDDAEFLRLLDEADAPKATVMLREALIHGCFVGDSCFSAEEVKQVLAGDSLPA